MRIIAIGGPHGSGKSSVAQKLAKELDMNYVSAGLVFRKLAKERNYSLEKFSEIVVIEPEIDRLIDERTKELSSKENTVVDAQLAAFFTPEATAIRICITASNEVRIKRISKREGISYENAKQETKVREETERQRFLDLYQIDLNDVSNYDVIINTDRLNENQTYALCKSIATHALNNLN